jgi:hypothetical protein
MASVRQLSLGVAVALVGLVTAVPARSAEPSGARVMLDVRRLFGPGGALSPVVPREESAPREADPKGSDRDGPPVLAVMANPALGLLGKWSARAEVAPHPSHAIFVEGSKLNVAVPGIDERVEGYSVDVGYHLYPMGRGLDGVYVGPRGFFGVGSTPVAQGTLLGYGGDVGYQWVVGRLAVNVGAGAARATATVQPKPEALEGESPIVRAQLAGRTEQRSFFVPIATAGLGVAF